MKKVFLETELTLEGQKQFHCLVVLKKNKRKTTMIKELAINCINLGILKIKGLFVN